MRVECVQSVVRSIAEVAFIGSAVICAFRSRVRRNSAGCWDAFRVSGNTTVNRDGWNEVEVVDCLSHGVSVDGVVTSTRFDVLSDC